jgi:hypothetical protein
MSGWLVEWEVVRKWVPGPDWNWEDGARKRPGMAVWGRVGWDIGEWGCVEGIVWFVVVNMEYCRRIAVLDAQG